LTGPRRGRLPRRVVRKRETARGRTTPGRAVSKGRARTAERNATGGLAPGRGRGGRLRGGGQRLDDLGDRRVVVRGRHEPGLVRRGRQVHALIEHGVEERGERGGVLPPGHREVGHVLV